MTRRTRTPEDTTMIEVRFARPLTESEEMTLLLVAGYYRGVDVLRAGRGARERSRGFHQSRARCRGGPG